MNLRLKNIFAIQIRPKNFQFWVRKSCGLKFYGREYMRIFRPFCWMRISVCVNVVARISSPFMKTKSRETFSYMLKSKQKNIYLQVCLARIGFGIAFLDINLLLTPFTKENLKKRLEYKFMSQKNWIWCRKRKRKFKSVINNNFACERL